MLAARYFRVASTFPSNLPSPGYEPRSPANLNPPWRHRRCFCPRKWKYIRQRTQISRRFWQKSRQTEKKLDLPSKRFLYYCNTQLFCNMFRSWTKVFISIKALKKRSHKTFNMLCNFFCFWMPAAVVAAVAAAAAAASYVSDRVTTLGLIWEEWEPCFNDDRQTASFWTH